MTTASTTLGRAAVRNPFREADGPAAPTLRPEQVVPDEGGCRATVRQTAMLAPLTWLDLEIADGAVALQACWLAAAPPAVGAEIGIRVRGDALVFPPQG